MKQLWVTAKRLPKMLANLDIRVKIIGLAVGSVIVLGVLIRPANILEKNFMSLGITPA